MEFSVFQEQIVRAIQEKGDSVSKVETCAVTKNNGVVWNGIRIFSDQVNSAPTIYLDELYREYCNGRTLSSVTGQILRIYEKSRMSENISMDFFMHFDQVQGKIVYRLIHYKRNETLLKNVPHIRFLDLAIVFVCLIWSDHIHSGSIMIRREHCDMWQVDTQELMVAAVKNTPQYQKVCVHNMEEIIREMFEERMKKEAKQFLQRKYSNYSKEQAKQWTEEMRAELEQELENIPSGTAMFVMGNQEKQYGAGTILYPQVLEREADRLGCNLFILPCSVHEVILLPDTGAEEVQRLGQMVREVNRTQLETEEILSDSVYYYDRVDKKLTIAYAKETILGLDN